MVFRLEYCLWRSEFVIPLKSFIVIVFDDDPSIPFSGSER